jgi:agmatinase
VIDPQERWRSTAKRTTRGCQRPPARPTPSPAEPGFDVAIVGAPMDDLVSDRPGALRAAGDPPASCPPGPHLEAKVDAFSAAGRRLRRRAGHPGRPRTSHAAIATSVSAVLASPCR